MSLELRDRDLGQLLGAILETATDQFGRLFLFQLVGTGPVFILQFFLGGSFDLSALTPGTPPDQLIPILARFYGSLLGVATLSMLLFPIESAAASLLVQQVVEGKPPDTWACLKGSLRLWPRTLIVVVTYNVAAGLGTLACIIPGFIIYALFIAAPAVVALEPHVPWSQVFQRARELLRGRFWEGLVVYVAVVYAPALVLAPFILAASALPGAAGTIVSYLLGTVLGMFTLVAPPVLYFHLRTVNEALDVERLAKLVDAIGAEVDGKKASGPA